MKVRRASSADLGQERAIDCISYGGFVTVARDRLPGRSRLDMQD